VLCRGGPREHPASNSAWREPSQRLPFHNASRKEQGTPAPPPRARAPSLGSTSLRQVCTQLYPRSNERHAMALAPSPARDRRNERTAHTTFVPRRHGMTRRSLSIRRTNDPCGEPPLFDEPHAVASVTSIATETRNKRGVYKTILSSRGMDVTREPCLFTGRPGGRPWCNPCRRKHGEDSRRRLT